MEMFDFTTGWVDLPPCAEPLALAQRFLREEIAFDGMHEAQIQWSTRDATGMTEGEPVPEWPARCFFKRSRGCSARGARGREVSIGADLSKEAQGEVGLRGSVLPNTRRGHFPNHDHY